MVSTRKRDREYPEREAGLLSGDPAFHLRGGKMPARVRKVRVEIQRAKNQLQPGRRYNLDRAYAGELIRSGHAIAIPGKVQTPRPQESQKPTPASAPITPRPSETKSQAPMTPARELVEPLGRKQRKKAKL